jgi:hypothetical protein
VALLFGSKTQIPLLDALTELHARRLSGTRRTSTHIGPGDSERLGSIPDSAPPGTR